MACDSCSGTPSTQPVTTGFAGINPVDPNRNYAANDAQRYAAAGVPYPGAAPSLVQPAVGVSKPLAYQSPAPNGSPKPLALGNPAASSTPGMTYTQPGAPLSYTPPQQQSMSAPSGGMTHDQWMALSPSTRAMMPEPGSQDEAYANQQAQNSNAIFASQGNNDPWALYGQQTGQQPNASSNVSSPNTYQTGGSYSVAAPPPPIAPTQGTGYQPGTQGLNGPYGNVQTTLNNSNVPALASGEQLMKMLQDSRDAAYKNAAAYLDPQFQNQQNALESQLTNQGIPRNSEAWNRAMGDFGRQKQFAYQQAESNAVNQGNAAQNQLFGQNLAANQNQFGQNLAGGQFGNAAQNQMAQQLLQQLGIGTQFNIAQMGNQLGNRTLDEQINQNNFNNSMGLRNQDINELLLQQQNPLQLLNMLMSGQNVQSPNFAQTPNANMAGTDINSILNGYLGTQNNAYNAQVGNQNSQIAGGATIGAALIAL